MVDVTIQDVRHGDPATMTIQNAFLMRYAPANVPYVTSAMIIDELHRRGGVDLVKAYLRESSDEAGIYRGLSKTLGVERREANAWWKNFVLTYK